MNDRYPTRFHLLVPLGFVAFGIALAQLTGRLQQEIVPDSASYLNYSFASLESMGRESRMPGYPLWLALWKRMIGLDYVPVAQVITHALASSWFAIALRRLGMLRILAIVAGITVGIGCTAMDNIAILSTDALAASAGVCTASTLMMWSRTDRTMALGLLTAAFAVFAIMLRPAYLFLIPWLFIAGAMLRYAYASNLRSSLRLSCLLSLVTMLPVLGWMTLRLVAVGEFAILPFGHQNLGAVLVQLVSEEELADLPGEAGELGREVLVSKQEYLRSGGTFPEGDRFATMTIEGSWDNMTYLILVPAADAVAGDDSLASHELMRVMNKEIIKRYPSRYFVWVLKNLRRGAWAIAADIVMHPIFLAVIGLSLLWCVYAAVMDVGLSSRPFSQSDPMSVGRWAEGTRELTIVAITYLIANLGFVALTSPTIGRFSDAAAIFVPAWLVTTLLSQQGQAARVSEKHV